MHRLLAVSLLFVASGVDAADKSQPRSLDPELKIELFAQHPTIVTPTGIDVDYKGRVFAVESNTHFPPKGYTGHKTDRVLVLEDTNGDGKADKTTVFTDGLTHTMSVAVKPLWLEMPKKSGKRKAESGKKAKPAFRFPLSAFVATRRDIWLYHDDNGDLQADRREQIIKLKTKGNYPHNGLAGIAFDAMGWMYFGFGENLGAGYTIIGSDGTKYSGGGEGGNLYRCRPDGSKLTKWATGFWNPHASCVDAFGRLFTVDNDPDSRPPCRLLHIIEGGDYGFRFRNGRKGLHPFTAWNGEIPGTLPMVAGTGEAPSGIVAYESDGLPKKYIGNLLVTSWGDHRIDRFVLKPKGASFVSRAEPIIQGGEEFRPVGLAVAPDGSLFCTDWVKRDYKLHGHGRIWRISRKQKGERGGVSPPRKKRVIDLSTITSKRPVKELEKMLAHPRLEVRRMAAILLSRSKNGRKQIIVSLANNRRPVRERIEALYAAATVSAGVFNFGFAVRDKDKSKIQSDDARGGHINEAIVSVTGTPQFPLDVYLDRKKGFSIGADDRGLKTKTDAFAWMRHLDRTHLQIALKVAYTPDNKDLDGLMFLTLTGGRFLLHGAVHTLTRNSMKSPAFLSWLRKSDEKLRLAIVLATRKKFPNDVEIPKVALSDPSADVRRVAVQWVAEEKLTKLKPQVEAVLHGKVMNTDLFLATLAALEMLDGKSPKDFDKTPAGKYVLPLVKDVKRPAVVRAQALRLVDPDDKSLSEQLFAELLASKNAKLKTEAVRALQHSQRRFAGKLLTRVATDAKSPAALRADAVAGLSGRSIDDVKMLRTLIGLTSSQDKAVRTEAVRSFRPLLMKTATGRPARIRILRRIRDALKRDPQVFRKDRSLRRVAELLVAGYRETGIALPAELQVVSKLRPKTVAGWYRAAKRQAGVKPRAGDVAAGRRVSFADNGAFCSRCHTVNGRGGNIGPDLSTIARTADRRKLVQSILEPSKEIAPQFTLWSFVMASGKIHHGIILGDTGNGKQQRIGTTDGKIVILPAKEIEERQPQSKSVMPDKLIDRLTATEFRDLLALLETLK